MASTSSRVFGRLGSHFDHRVWESKSSWEGPERVTDTWAVGDKSYPAVNGEDICKSSFSEDSPILSSLLSLELRYTLAFRSVRHVF